MESIFYYQGRGECDFVVQSGVEITSLIQVTWSMADPDTRKREIDGLLEASGATGCDRLLIITADETEEITTGGHTIHVVPAHRWLLK